MAEGRRDALTGLHRWRDDDPLETTDVHPVVPYDDDLTAARMQVQAAVADAEVEGRQLPDRVREIADQAGAAAGSKVARRIGLVGAVLALLASGALSVAAYSQAQSTDRTVEAALSRLDQANSTLESRGQPTVPAPPSPDPTDAIAAAVLAQVLASLPASPTSGEVASQLQAAVTGNVLGPSLDALTRQVAFYYQQNPPRPGPPPTEAQIRAAVEAVYAADPPADGRDGVDGQPPPCLSEPAQCRGADSTVPGPSGPQGQPGPACPDGYSLRMYSVVTTDGAKSAALCEEDT